jgi:16S rRNA (guanine966-N2)-methyltransferase
MRVIAGTLKGRRLAAPTWEGLRPTSDKLRETLFNILAPRVAGARVLDGYAGTGALGIEAISRGAAHVTFVERDRRAAALIEQNLERCGVRDRYVIIRADVGAARGRLSARSFDLILLDPPYDQTPTAALTGVGELVADDGLVVIEHAKRTPMPPGVDTLRRVREVKSGDSMLSFYSREPGEGAHGAPARERSGVLGPRERPSRGSGRSPD